jgi:hypothetical protein
MSTEVLGVGIVVIVVLVVVVLKMGTGVGKSRREELLRELEIASELAKTDSSSQKMAVIRCDVLFGKALSFHGVKGETVGELLRNSKDQFDRNSYEDVWKVHKLRNTLVHERYELSVKETEWAVSVYTSAIRRLVK